MRRICAWCGIDLDGEGKTYDAGEAATHGICRECLSFVVDGELSTGALHSVDGLSE